MSYTASNAAAPDDDDDDTPLTPEEEEEFWDRLDNLLDNAPTPSPEAPAAA